MTVERKPFWAWCGACGHCWVAAYTPMPALTFARVVGKARCPMCGGRAFVAKQDDGALLEGQGAEA